MENQNKPKNPNAFPIEKMTQYGYGMTLRDYFAAKAMQGLLSNPDWMHIHHGSKFLMHDETIADVSFAVADAMLKKREKE